MRTLFVKLMKAFEKFVETLQAHREPIIEKLKVTRK